MEKKEIYNLLRTAADNLSGYSSPDFLRSTPEFSEKHSAGNKNIPNPNENNNINEDFTPPSKEKNPAPPLSESHAYIQTQPAVLSSADSTLSSIAGKIAKCTRCPLSKGRKNTVPGEGVPSPLVLVVGEGPGYEEDVKGRPFVGPAGQLLDKMLASISLSRTSNTFIANIVKCRPPQNRIPYEEETAACISFLQAQIAILKPKMILCAGSTAAKSILNSKTGVTKLRGKFYDFSGIPVAVTYHPSALLRDVSLKRFAWEDLKMMREKLLEIAPDYQENKN